MFYTFSQNNSGGTFDYDEEKGISINVIIEAGNAEEANAKAESIGLYFDGVAEGIDCKCCGDRWEEAWEQGTEKPCIFGEPVSSFRLFLRRFTKDQYYCFVHYANGEVKKFDKEERD